MLCVRKFKGFFLVTLDFIWLSQCQSQNKQLWHNYQLQKYKRKTPVGTNKRKKNDSKVYPLFVG